MALSPSQAQTIAFASVAQQRAWLRAGELSPLELTQLYLGRIEQLDSRLGSYFTVMADQAIAEAQDKTAFLVQARSQGDLGQVELERLPPLWGIPLSVKDLNAVAGVPQSYGVAGLKDRIAEADDGVVTRLRQSGGILLGKTAIAQLASWPYSEPPGFLPCRNPWQPSHSAGGSSGGAAAAVAAGLCSLAQGSDGGGSLRTPAFCCGLVAIKPSRGRITAGPVGDLMGGLAVTGPLGRSVSDAALLLDALAGPQLGDWMPRPPTAQPFSADAKIPGQRPGPLRVAYAIQIHPFAPVAGPCAEAVQSVLASLAEAGATVEEIILSCEDWIDPFTVLWRAEVAAAGIPRALLEPMNQWLLDQEDSAGVYVRSRHQLQRLGRSLITQLAPFDLLVLPPCSRPAIPLGVWASLSPEETLRQIIQWIAPSPFFNVTGQPVLSLPTGQTAAGLPLGVQLVGRPGDEASLIRWGTWLEGQFALPPFWEIDRRLALDPPHPRPN